METTKAVTEQQEFRKFAIESLPRITRSELLPFLSWKDGEANSAPQRKSGVEIIDVQQGVVSEEFIAQPFRRILGITIFKAAIIQRKLREVIFSNRGV